MSEISNKRALYNLLIAQNNRILIFKELESYLNGETTKKEFFDGLSNIRLSCYEQASNKIALEEYKKYKIDFDSKPKEENLLNQTFAQWIDYIGDKLLKDAQNVKQLNEKEFKKDLYENKIFFKDSFLDLES